MAKVNSKKGQPTAPTAPLPRIAQETLARIMKLDVQIEAAQRQLTEYVRERETIAGPLLDKMLTGAVIESGPYTAALRRSERRVIAWKDVVEQVKGKAFCEKLMLDTPPRVTWSVIVSGPGTGNVRTEKEAGR